MAACPPAACDHFVQSLRAYVRHRTPPVELRSAALAVWNCLDPLPASCAGLVNELTGDQTMPQRFSQAARRIVKAI